MKIKHTGAPFTARFKSKKYKGIIDFITLRRPLKLEELAHFGKEYESELAGKPDAMIIEVDLRHMV